MNRQSVYLIFDIGKTTKKVLLFDENFHVLDEQTQNFVEIPDEDGFPSEDLPSLTKWSKDKIHYYLNHPDYLVTHINFSAYGASLVHLDANGDSFGTFYNYLKPIPPTCKDQFLKRYNKNGDLSTRTTSPYLGLLNSGLQLFLLKYDKPEVFRRIHTSLHFPQYFTHLLTGKKFSDITSLGCHTMLWDFEKKDYHEWVDQEDVRKLLGPVQEADHTLDYMYSDRSIKVGIGVHDSSAALMPYLVVMKEKFLLLSSGTWNICFNPFNHAPLTHNELSQDCLCYLTFEGKPVKASRIFLGHEHEMQQQAMASYFKVDTEYYKTIEFNEEVYKSLRNNTVSYFHPLGMEGTGPILNHTAKQTDYSVFKNFEEAQHYLIRQLVQWQKVSIDLIDPAFDVKNIIIVGGFTKSKLFLKIMKAELQERKILISDHPRGAALGAAWLVAGKNAYQGKDSLLNVSHA